MSSESNMTPTMDTKRFMNHLKNIGCNNFKVLDIGVMSTKEYSKIQPVYGLIFRCESVLPLPVRSGMKSIHQQNIYFCRDVTSSFSATCSLFNVIMNIEDPNLELIPELTELKQHTSILDSYSRGLFIVNQSLIQQSHKQNFPSTWKTDSTESFDTFDTSNVSDSHQENFRYICYVPYGGFVYEMDPLACMPSPIFELDKYWVDKVKNYLTSSMYAKYGISDHHIFFSLNALVSNPDIGWEKNIELLVKKVARFNKELIDTNPTNLPNLVPEIFVDQQQKNQEALVLIALESEIKKLQQKLNSNYKLFEENTKMIDAYSLDYLPFIKGFVSELVKKDRNKKVSDTS